MKLRDELNEFSHSVTSMFFPLCGNTERMRRQAESVIFAESAVRTDAVGVSDDYASIVAGNLTIGAVAAQANVVLPVAANATFAFQFQATKN